MRSTATVAAVTLAWALAVFVGPVAAKNQPGLTTVHCGQTLTQSVTLANDLTNCPGDGLVIGAAGITVDLNGHTIDGTATQLSDCNAPPFGPAGINNDGGFDGLTIANGTVQQFFNGISAGSEGTGMADSDLHALVVRDDRFGGISLGSNQLLNNHNRIERNETYGNGCGGGIFLNNADGNHVAHNRSHDNHDGIGVCCSPNNVVEHNVVSRNANLGIGVFFGNHSHNVIRRNSVTDNGDVGIYIAFAEGDQQNVVQDNAVSGNFSAGIVLDTANANQVHGNHVNHNGDDIIVFGDDNTVAGNHVADAVGCPEGCGFGISLEGGARNVIEHNHVARTKQSGIRVAAFDPGTPTTDSLIRDNLVKAASADDVLVSTEGAGTVSGTRIERNVALDASDDGFDIGLPGTTLTRNSAFHNDDLGIEAVAGTIDGGGNKAHGNGNPAQCTGVACT